MKETHLLKETDNYRGDCCGPSTAGPVTNTRGPLLHLPVNIYLETISPNVLLAQRVLDVQLQLVKTHFYSSFFSFFSRSGSLMRLTGWQSAASCHCVMCGDAAWTPSWRSVQWAANGLSSTARDGRRRCRRSRSSLLICFGWILPVWFVCDTEFVSRIFAFHCLSSSGLISAVFTQTTANTVLSVV